MRNVLKLKMGVKFGIWRPPPLLRSDHFDIKDVQWGKKNYGRKISYLIIWFFFIWCDMNSYHITYMIFFCAILIFWDIVTFSNFCVKKTKDAYCSDISFCIPMFFMRILVFELLSILYFTAVNSDLDVWQRSSVAWFHKICSWH